VQLTATLVRYVSRDYAIQRVFVEAVGELLFYGSSTRLTGVLLCFAPGQGPVVQSCEDGFYKRGNIS